MAQSCPCVQNVTEKAIRAQLSDKLGLSMNAYKKLISKHVSVGPCGCVDGGGWMQGKANITEGCSMAQLWTPCLLLHHWTAALLGFIVMHAGKAQCIDPLARGTPWPKN